MAFISIKMLIVTQNYFMRNLWWLMRRRKQQRFLSRLTFIFISNCDKKQAWCEGRIASYLLIRLKNAHIQKNYQDFILFFMRFFTLSMSEVYSTLNQAIFEIALDIWVHFVTYKTQPCIFQSIIEPNVWISHHRGLIHILLSILRTTMKL